MKKLMFIVMLMVASITTAWSQLDLVWDKTFPDSINIQFAKFSGDGKYIYVATNNSLKKMNTLSGVFEANFSDDQPSDFYFLGISASKNYLISANPGCFKVWDIKKEKKIKQFGGGIICFFISIDDKYMYWLYADGKIKVVDMQTDSIIKQIQTHTIQSAVMSNNGKMLAIGSTYKKANQSGGIDEYQKLEIWDTEKLEVTKIIQDTLGQKDGYWDLEFSYNNEILAFEPYPTSYINFYNLNTNKIEYTSKSPVARFSFAPDNSHLYSMSFEGFNYQKLYGEYLNYSGYGNTLESGGIQSNYNVFVGKLYKAKLYKNSTTGIIEQAINKFNISYNNNNLTIKNIDSEIPIKDITISDIQGKILYQLNTSDQFKNEISINIPLNTGIYFARIATIKEVITQKFQVMR